MLFVCVSVVCLPAGNAALAKPNEQMAADNDITGLGAPEQHDQKLAKPLSSAKRCFCVYLNIKMC